MFFDSTIYLIFLMVVVLIYWRLPFRPQNGFLLFASYFFYGWWDWRFLFLMAASTLADFLIAQRIDAAPKQKTRRTLLIFSVALNLAFLGFFKYFNFFIDSFVQILPVLGLENIPVSFWEIVLPPAISFYTFQEIAYIVDVYKGKIRPSKSLVDYALFVSLFPHLIAGPIQQPSHLLPQVQTPRKWSSAKGLDGVMLILEGLLRKVVIADNCALIANGAFNGELGPPSLPVVLLGTVAFALQIYGDFSGYSNMARGSAQLLGFHFMVNFKQPYLATSLQDFWRRWHISLSGWLREYLYVPLGGNRKGKRRTYINLMATMVLGGLWHGANWTFVVWGAIHGVGLAIERVIAGRQEGSVLPGLLATWVRRVLIFGVVCLAWVFFRSPSIGEALHFLSGVGAWEWNAVYAVATKFVLVYVVLTVLLDMHIEASRAEYVFADRSPLFKIATGVALAAMITLFGANHTSAFIYFQF